MYLVGFAVWLIIGVVAGLLARTFYPTAGVIPALTFAFAIFGAFIGGMLGVSGYIYHDPSPLRFGGLLGAILGGAGFPLLYHLVQRKAL